MNAVACPRVIKEIAFRASERLYLPGRLVSTSLLPNTTRDLMQSLRRDSLAQGGLTRFGMADRRHFASSLGRVLPPLIPVSPSEKKSCRTIVPLPLLAVQAHQT